MSQFSIHSYQTGPNALKNCTRNVYKFEFSIPETLMLNKMAQDIREALEDRYGTGLAEHMGTVGTCPNQFLAAETFSNVYLHIVIFRKRIFILEAGQPEHMSTGPFTIF
jgi:hypothetical protein